MKKFLGFFYANSWVNLACMTLLVFLTLGHDWMGWCFYFLYFLGWIANKQFNG